MTISISPQTQRLLEEQMQKGQFSDPDQVLRLALQSLDQSQGMDFEDLDSDTRSAIDESEAQAERGDVVSWEEVRKELRLRYIDK